MTKIEEIIEKCTLYYVELWSGNLASAYVKDEVIDNMKEYAEWYAKECLAIAANNVKMKWEWEGDGSNDGMQIIDKDSILNIKLPEHV